MNKGLLRRGLWIMPCLAALMIIMSASVSHAVPVYGITTANQLVRFDSATPSTLNISLAITGLQAGDTLVGIDFRPATGRLYALSNTSRLYIINTTTGAATFVANLNVAPNGTEFGFDFNPTVDRIRINSDADQNLRVNPADGTVTTDTPLAFMAGDVNAAQNPNVVAAAYLNSFGGATATTLYDIDSNLDILVTQNPANNGTLQTVGPLGVDTSNLAGFDIASANSAFAVLTVGGTSNLYSINLASGAATFIGGIGINSPLAEGSVSVRGLAIGGNRAVVDYDGDGRTDYSVFRLTNSTYYVLLNGSGGTIFQPFGQSDDFQTPGDYDGDGKTDFAVWRESVGTFFVLRSTNNTLQSQQFGQPGDEPVARDYDGDGKTDFAVARRTGGQIIWYVLQSTNGTVTAQQFGLDTDFVAPGDYDGDGRFDLAVQRNAGGQSFFYILQSTAGFRGEQFGLAGDLNVPGDYDGDGKTDVAVYRQGSQSFWYIERSSDGQLQTAPFGTKGDYTTQGDYDGDGKTDIAVFRPSNGTFYVLQSANGQPFTQRWGNSSDYPVANYDTH
jgi:hypothetical protein